MSEVPLYIKCRGQRGEPRWSAGVTREASWACRSTVMCSGSEEGSILNLIDFFITQRFDGMSERENTVRVHGMSEPEFTVRVYGMRKREYTVRYMV